MHDSTLVTALRPETGEACGCALLYVGRFLDHGAETHGHADAARKPRFSSNTQLDGVRRLARLDSDKL